jgi:TonB family protein
MTRSVLLAALALTPTLLHAQAISPTQTANPNVLQARSFAPAAIKPATAADSGSPVRVSTGVVAPKLIKKSDMNAIPGLFETFIPGDVTVVVSMTVDATGKPTDLSIAQGSGPVVDQEVLTAVSQFRFQPGTLDGQPFALPVRLQVVIQHGAR